MAHVMIVDDEDDVLVLCRVVLGSQGHECVVAGDGVEALELLADHRVDAVVTDLMMPRMDGVALRAAIRERLPHLPVLVWSAAPDSAPGGSSDDVARKDPLSLDVPALLRAA